MAARPALAPYRGGWLAENVPFGGWGIASADITRDGLPEVMLTLDGRTSLLKPQTPTRRVSRSAPFELGTYASDRMSASDGRPATGWHAEFRHIDNDGRLDLFIAKGNVDQDAPPMPWKTQQPC